MLRDPARLAARHPRAANVVEKRSLAVVDVTHHGHHRRPRQHLGGRNFRRFREQRVGIVELGRDRLVAHLFDQDHRRFLIEHLIDGDHRAKLHRRLDDLGSLDRHLVRKIRNGDGLGNRDLANELVRHGGADTLFALLAFFMTMASRLRLLPRGRAGAGGGVATAELKRAPARRFFLERRGGGLA